MPEAALVLFVTLYRRVLLYCHNVYNRILLGVETLFVLYVVRAMISCSSLSIIH